MANKILSTTDKDAEYKGNFVSVENHMVLRSIWN